MDKLLSEIQGAIKTAQELPRGREASLVVTKLQEAEFWHRAGLGLWSAPPEPEEAASGADPESEPVTGEDGLSEAGFDTEGGSAVETEPHQPPSPAAVRKKRPTDR